MGEQEGGSGTPGPSRSPGHVKGGGFAPLLGPFSTDRRLFNTAEQKRRGPTGGGYLGKLETGTSDMKVSFTHTMGPPGTCEPIAPA